MMEVESLYNVDIAAFTPSAQTLLTTARTPPHWVNWEIHRGNLGEITDLRGGQKDIFVYLSSKDPTIHYRPVITDPQVYDTLTKALWGNVKIKGWELCHCSMDPNYASTSIWKLAYERERFSTGR